MFFYEYTLVVDNQIVDSKRMDGTSASGTRGGALCVAAPLTFIVFPKGYITLVDESEDCLMAKKNVQL